jgi:hypothetical protein
MFHEVSVEMMLLHASGTLRRDFKTRACTEIGQGTLVQASRVERVGWTSRRALKLGTRIVMSEAELDPFEDINFSPRASPNREDYPSLLDASIWCPFDSPPFPRHPSLATSASNVPPAPGACLHARHPVVQAIVWARHR